jgi:hypothetical protein
VPKQPDAADTEIKRQVAALLRELQASDGQGGQAGGQAGASSRLRPQPQRKPLFGGEQGPLGEPSPPAAGADAVASSLPASSSTGAGAGSRILRSGARPLVCIVSDDLTFVETLGRCRAAGCATVSVCEARVEMRNAHVTLNWAAVQDGSYAQAEGGGA